MDRADAHPNNQAVNQKTKHRILVVEDDPGMKALLKKVIHGVSPEAEVSVASSLEQAFAQILQFSDISDAQPYELIVADIFLEGNGTGLDLWRVLMSTYPKIPLLVISSVSEDDVTEAIGEEQKKNLIFLKKPFTAQSFAVKVRHVLEKARPVETGGPANGAASDLMGSDERLRQMAHLLMLKISADWLARQAWLDEPYGGQNPAQELLFHTRVSANRLWEDFFVSKDNKLTLDKDKVREHILQISELTPELKEFLDERLNQMDSVFHSH